MLVGILTYNCKNFVVVETPSNYGSIQLGRSKKLCPKGQQKLSSTIGGRPGRRLWLPRKGATGEGTLTNYGRLEAAEYNTCLMRA